MSSERLADNDFCHVKWVNQSHALYLVSLLILSRDIRKGKRDAIREEEAEAERIQERGEWDGVADYSVIRER